MSKHISIAYTTYNGSWERGAWKGLEVLEPLIKTGKRVCSFTAASIKYCI